MSDSTSDPKKGSGLDLSSLTLAPSWVSDLETEDPGINKYADYAGPPPEKRRGGKGGRGNWDGGGAPGGGGGGRGRGQGGGGGGGRPQGGNRREGGGAPRGDRPQGGGGRNQQGRGGRGGPRQGGRGGNYQRQEIRTAPGITAKVQPTKTGVGALASMIKRTGRTYALIDLAKLVAGGRDRYEVSFAPDPKAKEQPKPLTFCTADGSLWLSKEEAIGHFIDSPALRDYYGTEEVTVDPPKGNFTGVAVCGFSGKLLGPPNHHSYQTTIQELHREEFSNMSLDRYKQRIRIETGEEIVEKWKELNGKRTEWVYPKPEEAKTEDPAPPTEDTPEAKAPQEEPKAEETPTPEADAPAPQEPQAEAQAPTEEEKPAEPEAAATPEPEAPAPAPEAAAPAPEATRLATRADLERHIREHLGDILFAEAGGATVKGDIQGRNLSPLLFGNLKMASMQVNRAPSILIAPLCNQLEKEGLKLFRWGGKNLFAAAHRPHQLISDTPLSDSIRAIFEYISAMPKPKVTDLLEALAPTPGETVEIPTEIPTKDAEAAPPKQLTPAQVAVLKDLRWLIGEGYVIEFSDGTLDAVRVRPKEEPKPVAKKKKAEPKKEESKPESAEPLLGDAPQPEPEAPKEEEPKAEEPKEEPAPPAAETPPSE